MNQTSQAMDFFAHQDSARRSTRRFVILYTIAVVVMCVSIGVIGALVSLMANGSGSEAPDATATALAVGIGAGVLSALLIGGGSLHRIAELRGGGSAVAEAMGGRIIDPSTRDPDERRVLNVVEEMAIASGVPVPPVYLMANEKGINAFAAGYSPGDAVIGVTRGCVTGLTRDELQGVMAHEFSHILNGDMRLNIRMIGLLSGILILTVIGQTMLRFAPYNRRSSRDTGGGGAVLVVLAVALAMLIIGAIGAFAARLIQAAVSRQREFLADASAVQFTRNPDGIGDALRRIGGASAHARVRHPRAQEAGHMFFGEALGGRSMLGGSLASHPPLPERIKRVLPGWDGSYLEPITSSAPAPKTRPSEDPRERIERAVETMGGDHDLGAVGQLLPLLALSGTLSPLHAQHAQKLIGAIPEPLREAARDTYSGRAVVYALLLDRKHDALRQKQIEHLGAHADPAIARLTQRLAPQTVALPREHRLPLLDMTLGSLAHLSERQHLTFRKNVDALVKMDQSIDLFEWVTINTLKRHLDERFGMAAPVPVQYYNLNRLGREVSVLLSMIAHTGSKDQYGAGEAVLMGESAVRGIGVSLLPPDQATMRDLDNALKTLRQCAPRVKKQLLQAAALVVGADREVTTSEAELLRTVADALGVPTPPLLPGQKLA